MEPFGHFVAGIPAPLGIGKLELEDGRWVPGFLAEPLIQRTSREITAFQGWRPYLETTGEGIGDRRGNKKSISGPRQK